MDFEFNPIAAGVGLLGGLLAMVVSSQVETGIVIKIATFAITSVACYFVFSKIALN
jgi:Na+-transporting NADH:ubiquinone oxidoreductase subunit NqrD